MNSDEPLIHFLGQVLMESREEAGVSKERLAASDPGGVTTNTLFRFEKGTNARYWPRDPEYFVKLYADAINESPAVLWLEAVTRFASSHGVSGPAHPSEVARADVQRAIAR